MAKRRREPPADEERCTRTDGKRWRCFERRLRDHRYCRKHQILYLATLDRNRASKPSSGVRVKKEKKTPRAGAGARASKPSSSSSSATAKKERKSPKIRVSAPVEKEAVGNGETSSQELLNPAPETPEPGQIWALPDESDGHPRVYARVEKIDADKGTAEVTLLVPHPVSDDERRWVEEGVPAACGMFRPGKSSILVALAAFSHRMVVEEEESSGEPGSSDKFYKIFPRKGEVWAVYQRWDKGKKNLVFRLVEVVSGFTVDEGVTVAALSWVEGSDAVFQRQVVEGFELVKTLSRKELLRFSHQAVACKETEDEIDGGRSGRWNVIC
ncbi:uncharacterized protein LOC103708060 isoform X1 [Phoenix dactylifera]|uniref:Uncharacterized protein LOC103708060 isoform X1 n=1 Tax=Phoenix dactylifera TaxID=42345 RepID=A0A8B9AZR0_PHODC|nr:uncharacterized protein LOC103708060 isoform X1 [Phoenix dactylifera]